MGECNGRPIVAFVAAATLALSSLGAPSTALAEDACPPQPPYGVPAYVIEFEWDQPVAVEYGVATEVRPHDEAMPGVWPMLGGDFAVLTGGCDDPVEPLLITRRDQSLGTVDRAHQAAPGIGTYSVCATGADWAGMAKSQEVPGEPWTYTIAAVGVRPCEGAYTDSTDDNFITTRKQPKSTTVTATITYYPALQTAPTGAPMTLKAKVGVVNAKSLDNARFEGGPDEDYERPPPAVLGTVTLPSIGSPGDSGATPVPDPMFEHFNEIHALLDAKAIRGTSQADLYRRELDELGEGYVEHNDGDRYIRELRELRERMEQAIKEQDSGATPVPDPE